jgi:hypothetical protein
MIKRRTVFNSLKGALLVSSVAMALAGAVNTTALAQATTLTHMSSQGWILDPER